MKKNLRVITKKLQRGRNARRSGKGCGNFEKTMKTLLLQNQQIIIQQQNMMFMVMKQFHSIASAAEPSVATTVPGQPETMITQLHDTSPDNQFAQATGVQLSSQQHMLHPLHATQQHHQQAASDNHQQQHHVNHLVQTSQQQAVVVSSRSQHAVTTATTTMAGHQQSGPTLVHLHHQQQQQSHHEDEPIQQHHHNHQHHHQHQEGRPQLGYTHHHIHGQHQQQSNSQQPENSQSQQQHLQQVGTPARVQAEAIAAAYLTPVASEQDPISDSKPDDDDISAFLGGDDLLTSNLLYNPQTDIGQITPYKSQQPLQETPSYYSSGAESLTTPRVEQQQPRQPATANINQAVVKNLADSFKSPSKPKINVQILSGSATRNMKNNKAKIIQRMNISEFLRHVHQDDQAHQQAPVVKNSASQ